VQSESVLSTGIAAPPAASASKLKRSPITWVPSLYFAQGVPFFVVSCVQAIHLEDGAWQGARAVPWTVAQSVRQRITALSAAAQEVLGIAGVLGREIQPMLLAAVAAKSEDDVIGALEAAQRLRLLEEHRGAYRFAHDLVREVVEADVGLARQVVLHRRAGEALEARPGEPPVALLAYHYGRSDAHDKAVFYLERAGDQAGAQFAHATAEECYRELVKRLERTGRFLEAARAREKLGAILWMEARHAMALAALEPAADRYREAGDLVSLGRVAARIGLVHSQRGTLSEGLALVQPLIPRLEAHGPSHELALLYLALAELLENANRLGEALVATERATELAPILGDTHVAAQAGARRGVILEGLGRARDAQVVLEDAAPLAEAVGDLRCLNEILNVLAHRYLHQGNFQTSMLFIGRALGLAERIDDARNIAFELMHRGLICFCSGAWVQARADSEHAASLCDTIDTFIVSSYPYMVLGFVCYGEGRWQDATEHLNHCVSLAESGAPEALVMAQSFLAELDLLEGHAESARSRVLAVLERFGPEVGDNAYLLPKLAWAHLELGDLAQAEAAAEEAVAFAQRIDDFLNLVEAVRVQALILMARQRWAEAEQILSGILLQTQSTCYPWGEARVLDTYALLHMRRGAHGLARERLEAGLALYTRLGARKDVERIEQHLVQLGLADHAAGNDPSIGA